MGEIEDADIIHIYMNNYNWDDGFGIPKRALSNPCCELSTALMMFYLADGLSYLEDKENVKKVDWSNGPDLFKICIIRL